MLYCNDMSMKELVPLEPSYAFAKGELADAATVRVNAKNIDVTRLTELRNGVSDKQCGRYRECWTRPSEIPGCGARLAYDDSGLLSTECPAGTVVQYTNCAQRVLNAIVDKID